MKCTLVPSIASMSGKCGNVLFKTFKRANGEKETRAYFLPVKSVSPLGKRTYGYKRRAKLSENEIKGRGRFQQAASYLARMSEETKAKYAKEWKADKYKLNGKRYKTLRGYIIARLYADNAVKSDALPTFNLL